MKLAKILLEQPQQLTLGDLQFGVNVQQGDALPKPNSDELIRINNKDSLDSYLQDKDLSLPVIIDRDEMWFNRFIIPAFVKGRQDAKNRIGDFMSMQRNK